MSTDQKSGNRAAGAATAAVPVVTTTTTTTTTNNPQDGVQQQPQEPLTVRTFCNRVRAVIAAQMDEIQEELKNEGAAEGEGEVGTPLPTPIPKPNVEHHEVGTTIHDLDLGFEPVLPFSARYYSYCGLGGAVAAALTIGALNPFDLIKTNRQVNPKMFPNNTLAIFKRLFLGEYEIRGFRAGFEGMYSGSRTAAVGYGLNGYFKFGFYEFFKNRFTYLMGEDRAHTFRDFVRVASIIPAEAIAVIALTPFETLRVRQHTNPNFALKIGEGFAKIHHLEGFGSLYAGLNLVWARQLPMTAIGFVTFERVAETLYRLSDVPKHDMTQIQQHALVFTAGYLSGVVAAVATHPLDTLFSLVNRVSMEGTLRRKIDLIYNGTSNVPGIGWNGLWRGLSTRIFWLGSIFAMQWSVYSAYRSMLGLSTPGDDYRWLGETSPPLVLSKYDTPKPVKPATVVADKNTQPLTIVVESTTPATPTKAAK